METRTDISTVIVTYNPANIDVYVKPNVELLKIFGIKTIVVDNGGNKLLSDCEFLSINGNIGYGAAVNRGMSEVKTEYSLVMNDDIKLTEEFIEGLLESLRKYSSFKYGVVGFKVISSKTNRTGISKFNYGPLILIYHFSILPTLARIFSYKHKEHSVFETIHYSKSSKPVKNLSGAIFLIREDIFRMVGGFDEKLFLTYEETELFRRISKSGCVLYYDNSLKVRHLHSFTASKSSLAYSFRSMKYFLRKHYPQIIAEVVILWVFIYLYLKNIVTLKKSSYEYKAFTGK